MRHLTTAFISLNPGSPDEGLTQNMLDKTQPLSIENIIAGIVDYRHNLGTTIERDFIIQAIRHVHSNSLDNRLRKWAMKPTEYQPTDKAVIGVTDLIELQGMHLDSGTSDGTHSIHHQFMKQLGILSEEDLTSFETRLILLYGDQNTTALSRLAKRELAHSRSAFERRNWLLPVPALFHFQMNFIQGVMVRTHWNGSGINPFKSKSKQKLKHAGITSAPASESVSTGSYSPHTILADLQTLNYKGLSPGNTPFHLLDTALLQGFYARLLGLFYKGLRNVGLLNLDVLNAREEVDRIIPTLSKDQFQHILSNIQDEVFSAEVWKGGETDSATFTTMCRYVQQLKVYFTLRQACRSGDIGMIRKLLPIMAAMFYGTGKNKYGLESLYLSWLLQENVSSAELRRAILNGSFVNLKGTCHSFIPTDRFREFLNGALALVMKRKKNSTHDWDHTFRRFPLQAYYVARLKKNMEQQVQVSISSSHTKKDSSGDVHSIAIRLLRDGDMDRFGPLSSPTDFRSIDVIQVTLDQIVHNVNNFNRDFVEKRIRTRESGPNPGAGDPDGCSGEDSEDESSSDGEIEGNDEYDLGTEDNLESLDDTGDIGGDYLYYGDGNDLG